MKFLDQREFGFAGVDLTQKLSLEDKIACKLPEGVLNSGHRVTSKM